MSNSEICINVNAFKTRSDRFIWDRKPDVQNWTNAQRSRISHALYENALRRQAFFFKNERQLIITPYVQSVERISDLLENELNTTVITSRLSASARTAIYEDTTSTRCFISTEGMFSGSLVAIPVIHIASMTHLVANKAHSITNIIADNVKRRGVSKMSIQLYVAIDDGLHVEAVANQFNMIVKGIGLVDESIVPVLTLNNVPVDQVPGFIGINASAGILAPYDFMKRLLSLRDLQRSFGSPKPGRQLMLPISTEDEQANLFASVTSSARQLQQSVENSNPHFMCSMNHAEQQGDKLTLTLVFNSRIEESA
jgi:hypothetical protein